MVKGSTEVALAIMNVVAMVPCGSVATYGQVAKLAGFPKHARYVGTLLKNMDVNSHLPWHRIINGQGGISLSKLDDQGMNFQAALLMAEGIVLENGKVDLKRYQWRVAG